MKIVACPEIGWERQAGPAGPCRPRRQRPAAAACSLDDTWLPAHGCHHGKAGRSRGPGVWVAATQCSGERVSTPRLSPLPHVDGVDPCRQRLPPGPWQRLGDYLLDQFPSVSEESWRDRLASGRCVDGAGGRLDWAQSYPAGTALYYYREVEAEPPVPFAEAILYQDEDLLVADKPHFLAVVPAGRFLRETLLVRLRQRTGLAELTPLHRLDRHTAGLVLFSCRAANRGSYTDLFRQRRIRKVYEAVAPLDPQLQWPLVRRSRIAAGEPFFRMAEVAGPANAETRIHLLASNGREGLYQLEPVSGRKHQLRLHLSGLGLPILDDPLYPVIQPEDRADDFTRPMQLLARSLAFADPLTGEARHFESQRRLGFVP